MAAATAQEDRSGPAWGVAEQRGRRVPLQSGPGPVSPPLSDTTRTQASVRSRRTEWCGAGPRDHTQSTATEREPAEGGAVTAPALPLSLCPAVPLSRWLRGAMCAGDALPLPSRPSVSIKATYYHYFGGRAFLNNPRVKEGGRREWHALARQP